MPEPLVGFALARARFHLALPCTSRIDKLLDSFSSNMALPMKKSVMKSAMKSMKKAAKPTSMNKTVMKKKKAVSKIARGKRAKAAVFLGRKEKTASGHSRSDLMKTKHGRIVTKAKHAQGKKAYAYISAWTKALQKARKELGIKGFCAVNGKTAQGKALYAKTKAIFSA